MSETRDRTEGTYLQVLIKALSHSESGLSEPAVAEPPQAGYGECHHSLDPPDFLRSPAPGETTRKPPRIPRAADPADRLSRSRRGPHYSFRDSSLSFDFTFGMFIAAYGLLGWIVYGLDTERMSRRLKESQRILDEMNYRWIANGGSDARLSGNCATKWTLPQAASIWRRRDTTSGGTR